MTDTTTMAGPARMKDADTTLGTMAAAAVEGLAARLEATNVTFRLRDHTGTSGEYQARLYDGSILDLQIGLDDLPFARLRLTPGGMANGIMDLYLLGGFARPGLFGRSYQDVPPIPLDELPVLSAFLDRARDACRAAGQNVGDEAVVPTHFAGPAPR